MQAEAVERLARALAARDEVVFAYLFGSQARGEAGPRSDVDVGAFVRDDAPEAVDLEIAADARDALGRDDVDLVLLNRAPLSLAFEVLRGRLLVSRDEGRRVVEEAAIMSRYHDRSYYRRRHLRAAADRIAERGFA